MKHNAISAIRAHNTDCSYQMMKNHLTASQQRSQPGLGSVDLERCANRGVDSYCTCVVVCAESKTLQINRPMALARGSVRDFLARNVRVPA